MSKRSGNIFAIALLMMTLLYGLFQGRALIDGPKLYVHSPVSGETATGTLLEVSGTTKHVTHIRINGNEVTMDTTGGFSEKLVTPNGYGSILVEASDRFGHTAEERIEFYGRPQNS